jgi:hypothetical protein
MATDSPERRRLREARAALKAEGWGNVAIYQSPRSVVINYSRPVAERDAATRYVQGQEAFADEWGEDGPAWRGWGLHAAFLAGVDWQREQGTDATRTEGDPISPRENPADGDQLALSDR